MKKTFLLFAVASLFLVACNQPSTNENSESATPENSSTNSVSTPENTGTAVLALSAGDDMKYDKTELHVKEGQTVQLTLKHTGKSAVTAMGHNFVLLVQGVSPEDFAKSAIDAKDNDYIPANSENQIIAHTKTIGGGDSATIEFKAPAKGVYDYLCSFPGHIVFMKGKFYVE